MKEDNDQILSEGTPAEREAGAAQSPGSRAFAFSLGLHAALCAAIAIASVLTFHRPKREPMDVMAEFTVAVPAEPEPAPDPAPAAEPAPEPPPAPVRTAEPEPVPEPVRNPPKPPKPTKPPKPKIDPRNVKVVHRDPPKPERKTTKVTLPPKVSPQRPRTTVTFDGPKLSPREIERLLQLGAKPSDHTSVPASELQRCYAIIQRQLYEAWIRPDASNVSSNDPVIAFRIGPGGRVLSASLSKSSGNAVLDESVVSAARSIGRFNGLSESFVRANQDFTVAFRLEGGA